MQERNFDYSTLSDEELVELSAGGDKRATEIIFSRYKNLVKNRAKAYYLAGADHDDIVQEGMIGLFKAIRDFDITKQPGFRSFADLCIKRNKIKISHLTNSTNFFTQFSLNSNENCRKSTNVKNHHLIVTMKK